MERQRSEGRRSGVVDGKNEREQLSFSALLSAVALAYSSHCSVYTGAHTHAHTHTRAHTYAVRLVASVRTLSLLEGDRSRSFSGLCAPKRRSALASAARPASIAARCSAGATPPLHRQRGLRLRLLPTGGKSGSLVLKSTCTRRSAVLCLSRSPLLSSLCVCFCLPLSLFPSLYVLCRWRCVCCRRCLLLYSLLYLPVCCFASSRSHCRSRACPRLCPRLC